MVPAVVREWMLVDTTTGSNPNTRRRRSNGNSHGSSRCQCRAMWAGGVVHRLAQAVVARVVAGAVTAATPCQLTEVEEPAHQWPAAEAGGLLGLRGAAAAVTQQQVAR